MNYAGGKNGSGVYQHIINQMPPHDVYIEAFLGSGAVMRLKKSAAQSIGIDSDARACKMFRAECASVTIINDDAISSLPGLIAMAQGKRVLVYADPPYLGSTRSCKRPIYKHEMMADEDHRELLAVLKSLDCMVMLSGYFSKLYERELKGWRTVTFPSMTRGGHVATEWLWMNYPEPFELHDYSFLGQNFRERERIKRKKQRWLARLSKMPALERWALLDTVNAVRERAK
jgi:DNA adenine methylase